MHSTALSLINAHRLRRVGTAAGLAAALAGALLAVGCTARAQGPAATEYSRSTKSAPAAGVLHAAEPTRAHAADAPVAFQDLDWFDAARNRAVPVRLYWPHGVAPDAQVPLVVFSHGIGGSRRGYSYLGAHFAANGIASLHVQHVGSDRALWGGNPLDLVARLQAAARDGEAIERVRDLRFALDRMLADPRAAQIDSARIVAAGHSYGANTTLLAVGARVQRDGQLLDYRDPRFAAAIVISAPPFYGATDPGQILRHVRVPTLHITATDDVIRIPGYHSPAADRIAVFEATGGAYKTLAVFDGGSHSMFTDRAATGGVALNPLVKRATQDLSLAFLQSVFDGRTGALASWPQRFPGIVARFRVAG